MNSRTKTVIVAFALVSTLGACAALPSDDSASGTLEQSTVLADAAPFEATAAGDVVAQASAVLTFRPRSGINLLDVVSDVERAYFLASGLPLVAVVEVKPNYSTDGKFTTASAYSGLTAFASAMQAQDSNYKWEVIGGTKLVVKPAVNSVLSKNVTNFVQTGKTACAILKEMNKKIRPTLAGTGGCLVRDTPEYISDRAAYDVTQQAISVSYSGTRTYQATVLDVLGKLSSPVGVTVYSFDSRMHLVWEVRW